MFWKTISRCFVNSSKKRSKITLADEKDNTLSDNEKTSKTKTIFLGT